MLRTGIPACPQCQKTPSFVAAVAYVILGFLTGVLGGPCSTAPAWWEGSYFFLPLPLLAAALWAGLRVANKFLRP